MVYPPFDEFESAACSPKRQLCLRRKPILNFRNCNQSLKETWRLYTEFHELIHLHHPLASECFTRENCSNLLVGFITGRPKDPFFSPPPPFSRFSLWFCLLYWSFSRRTTGTKNKSQGPGMLRKMVELD